MLADHCLQGVDLADTSGESDLYCSTKHFGYGRLARRKAVCVVQDSILVTGSSGLIGRAVIARMAAEIGVRLARFDLLETDPVARADILDHEAVRHALTDIAGIIHLAGMSRVLWAERSPSTCWQLNVEATRNILDLALRSPRRPWIIYASSREVYGQQADFPVPETAPLNPMNAYARSKCAAEQLVWHARDAGLRAAVIRFSSVYGSVDDHPDRVVPALAFAAAFGGTMRLDGPDCTFDFTHVADVARGLVSVCASLSAGERSLPPLHFVSGTGTSLRELSEIARSAAPSSRITVTEKPSRTFDVVHFCGDPRRAAAVLGWQSSIPLRDGISKLVTDYIARSTALDLLEPVDTLARPKSNGV